MLLLLALGACGSSPWARMTIPGDVHHVTEESPGIGVSEQHMFGSMILCLDRPGSAVVTSVSPLDASGGFRVVDFGLRPSPFWKHTGAGVGDAPGGLERNHFQAGRTLPVTCDAKTGRGYELGVVVERTGPGKAVSQGFHIGYRSDGHDSSLNFPLTVVLCPAGCPENGT
jgi:hypothetical protein